MSLKYHFFTRVMIKKIILSVILISTFSFSTSKEEIANKIKEIISNLPSNSASGILIYNPLTQDTIFSLNQYSPMTPASLTKIFTTAISLSLMGSEHKLSTKIFVEDLDISDGSIDGNLYIKGFGNSTFSDSDLQELVDRLIQRGIHTITGEIIGDDSFFDDIYTRADWIEDEGTNIQLPPVSALVLERNKITTRKKVRRRYRYVTELIKNPPIFVANRLLEKLKSNGIEVTGTALSGVTPVKSYAIAEKSILLKDLIALVNKHSDNFFAECLFKTLGAESSKVQGNSFFSQQAIQKFMKENGIFSQNTEIVDGSGISRSDQVTPSALNGVLEKMYFDLNHYDDFYNSLSIAGVDGTLGNRMMGTYAENNFRGKTGSLNGVSGLAGYLTLKNGDDLIITIMFEYSKGGWGYYRDIQDQIVILLADWEIESSDQ